MEDILSSKPSQAPSSLNKNFISFSIYCALKRESRENMQVAEGGIVSKVTNNEIEYRRRNYTPSQLYKSTQKNLQRTPLQAHEIRIRFTLDLNQYKSIWCHFTLCSLNSASLSSLYCLPKQSTTATDS